jgi:hypothetical protein
MSILRKVFFKWFSSPMWRTWFILYLCWTKFILIREQLFGHTIALDLVPVCTRRNHAEWGQFCAILNDLFPNEQNFHLDKSRQKLHHSLKEHHKISNIPKFRCEML